MALAHLGGPQLRSRQSVRPFFCGMAVKKQPTEHAAHPNAEGHVDIPEGLLRNRQGPLNARTGRKDTD